MDQSSTGARRRLGACANHLRDEAQRAVEELLEALWPRGCWLCRAPVATEPIRAAEARDTRDSPDACPLHVLTGRGLIGNRCARCARHLPHGVRDGETCRACRARAPRFARVVAAGEYGEPLSAWVLALKHGGRRDLARPLARHLAAGLAAQGLMAGAPLLCPVPLHPLRRLERGYDQAQLLARALGEELALPVVALLVRLRATTPQGAEGGRATRRANVAGAFGLARTARARAGLGRLRVAGRFGLDRLAGLAGRDVWLVDDVFTSGATADACAEVLRRGGARSVTVVVLARAGAHARGERVLEAALAEGEPRAAVGSLPAPLHRAPPTSDTLG